MLFKGTFQRHAICLESLYFQENLILLRLQQTTDKFPGVNTSPWLGLWAEFKTECFSSCTWYRPDPLSLLDADGAGVAMHPSYHFYYSPSIHGNGQSKFKRWVVDAWVSVGNEDKLRGFVFCFYSAGIWLLLCSKTLQQRWEVLYSWEFYEPSSWENSERRKHIL